MARIRSIKPEFWDDDVIGSLSRDARLLFAGTWTFADDEGLLRWTSVYLKSQVFMYDDDLGLESVDRLMAELVKADLVFPYKGGTTQQRLAFVVHFHRHQKVNRPQPSKLPPPSLQNREVRLMYARRDGWVCHLCGVSITEQSGDPSPDHLVPRVSGGSDYPSNIRSAHLRCNQSRGSKPLPEGPVDPVSEHAASADPRAMKNARSHSLNDSPPEGRGGVKEGNGGGGARGASPAISPSLDSPPPPRRCPKHETTRNPGPCGPCADARREHQAWERSQPAAPSKPVGIAPPCPIHPGEPAGRCGVCEAAAVPPPANLRPRKDTR